MSDEVLKAKVLSLYEAHVENGDILPLGRSDSSWIEVTADDRVSHSQSLYIGELLEESNIEEVLSMAEESLDLMVQQAPDALFMASIRLFEYGEKIVGSPTGSMWEDDEGIFSESWQGIPAVPCESFMVRLATKLEAMLDTQETSAALIESITIRALQPSTKGKP
jgi:hypothetical protein